MSLSQGIKRYKNVLPSDVCKRLITTFHRCEATQFDTDIYKFQEVNMMNSPEYSEFREMFTDVMFNVHQRYSKSFPFFPETDAYEAPRVKRYSPKTGIFNWHCDATHVESCKRILVMFFYLNNVEKGGETIFDLNGKKIKVQPVEGSVVCFPPTWQYPHMGSTPMSGPKYVISSYVQAPQ